jgi:hypothetical protein
MMMQLSKCVLLLVVAGVLSVMSFAQTQEDSPAPAPASAEEPQLQGRETYEPETTPLSGSQLLGFGFSSESLNVLNIGASVHQQFDSNIGSSGTEADFGSVTSLAGNVDLNRQWKRNSLSLHYTGGGSFYSGESAANTVLQNNMFHTATIAQALTWRRWTMRLGDEFTYSPYAYGYGLGGFGYPNPDMVLHPGEVPDQSIYSTRSSRLGNTLFANLDYLFTRRTAVTFSGSYGVLKFKESSYFDSNEYGGGVGVSHQLTGHDSIAGNYRFSRNQYDVLGTSFETHTAEFRYGRRITGRLGFELWGGPQFNHYDSGPVTQRDVIASGGVNLRYRTRVTEYWVGYSRGVQGGSGVLLGSVADSVAGSVSRGIGRNWSVGLNGGYSRNGALITGSKFNSGFGRVVVRRSLGQYTGVGANYSLLRQTGNCVAGNCPFFTRHIIGVSFDWRLKPIQLD